MTVKVDAVCMKFTKLIGEFRDGMINAIESYITTKIDTFKLQLSKLEFHKQDLKLMRDDIKANDENIQEAPIEYLTNSRFTLIIEKFSELGTKLRNVCLLGN